MIEYPNRLKPIPGDIVVVRDYDGIIRFVDLVLDTMDEWGYYPTYDFVNNYENKMAWQIGVGEIV